ncbi:MAG TPA: glycosyltransferase 87 family protein, partial [Blastocatellia bacterium]|nr:glycosyltransferase 87 family protein [Blastocatellia bacterium]
MKELHATFSGRRPGLANLTLIALGLAMFALYERGRSLLDSPDSIVSIIAIVLVQGAFYAISAWIVWRACAARPTLIIVIAFAALFRLSLLFTPPALSSDMYRYIWDGRVQAAGINPYRYVPVDEALEGLRDEAIYPRINRSEYAKTIYPPVAQIIFLAVTRISESVIWMKAAMVGFEAITLWALAQLLASLGHPRHRLLIYAWHPLPVWEFAGSGHIDAAAIAFIALALLARRRKLESAAGVALACAALIKLIPVVLFPALYRRWGWKMPLGFAETILLAYLPYLSVGADVLGFLPGYSEEEGLLDGSRFFLLSLARRALSIESIPSAPYFIFALLVLLSIAIWSLARREQTEESYIRRALVAALAFTLLLSPRYAWYFAWLVPFLCFAPMAAALYVTNACF